LFHADPRHPERVLQIDTKLSAHKKDKFKKFLSENLDVFARSPTDIPGVDSSVICHKLPINLHRALALTTAQRTAYIEPSP